LDVAMMRTLTLIVRLPPTRSNSRSCSTRSSLACRPAGISLTSSRSSVPWFASSKRPSRRSVAPVKAPRSWPKNSLSIRVSEMAAQLTLM
jgi:hypothetical protein